MVLGALGCMNNVDFENKKVNDNIVLDVVVLFILILDYNMLY